jgi:hypothetical protein
MNEPNEESPIERIASLLEAAQFRNGSLDITMQGPESEWVGSPLKMILDLRGEAIKELSAELSGVAAALHDIANAIREPKQ